jgi:CHAT domain
MRDEHPVLEHDRLAASVRQRIARYRAGYRRAVADDAAIAEAQRLTELAVGSAMDRAEQEEMLALLVEFELCLSEAAADRDPGMADEIYRHAVDLMVPLLAYNPDRVPRVFWSQIRQRVVATLQPARRDGGLALSTPMRERLLLLEAMLDRSAAENRTDGEALELVAEVRWRRFLATPEREASAELIRCTEAFASAARLGPLNAPTAIVDYLSHLEVVGPRSTLFGGSWLATMGDHLPATGRAVLMARRRSAEATPDSRASAQASLSHNLLLRYQLSGHRDDLDEAIAWAEDLLRYELSDEDTRTVVEVLGPGLAIRAELDGRTADCAQAYELVRNAVEILGLEHAQTGRLVECLTLVALAAASLTGGVGPVDDALAVLQRCEGRANLPAEELALRRSVLLTERCRRTGDLTAVDQAIAGTSRIVSAMHRFDPKSAPHWVQLAHARRARFRVTGRVVDLTGAIRDLRVAINRSEDQAPWLRDQLAGWLLDRYRLAGDANDMREAAETFRQLAQEQRRFHPELTYKALATLLNAGLLEEAVLRQVIEMCRAMVTQPSQAGVDDARWLYLMSGAALELAEKSGDDGYLDEAVEAARAAVPPSGSEAPAATEALARVLLWRGGPADLDEAAALLAGLIDHTGESTGVGQLRTRLAATDLYRFQRTGDAAHQRAGVELLRQVATSPEVYPRVRGDAAYLLAEEATTHGDFTTAAEGYGIAVQIIAEQARRPVRPGDRHEYSRRWAEAARNGAACAIRAGQPRQALLLLEHGRAVNVTQTLQRRSDLARLRQVRPDLAEEMSLLVDAIEGFAKGYQGEIPRDHLEASHPLMELLKDRTRRIMESVDSAWILRGDNASMLSEEVVREVISEDTRHELSARWDEFVTRVRDAAPTVAIGASPDIDALVGAVPEGAAVLINISRLGCDAVIVRDGGISVLPLTDLTLADVHRNVRGFLSAIYRLETGDRSAAARSGLRSAMRRVQEWLWEAVAAPVLDVLGYRTAMAEAVARPRVWWIPTGALSVLPIHAAGRFGPDGRGTGVLDRVVSSYTTTLGALWRARIAARAGHDDDRRPRLLAVAVPHVPGALALSHTDVELAATIAWIPAGERPMTGNEVTINTVTDRLKDHDWVHFACHGTPTLPGTAPAQLYLSNNVLTVNRLAWLTGINAELAYLSACHTAGGLPDEGDHVAAAFQATGYQHVIGTLWGAVDRVAAQVAADFYGTLEDRGAGADAAAEALHEAVRRQQERYPDNAFLWAPFVHFGP